MGIAERREGGPVLTYLLVLYGGQGVDVLLETISRLDCNTKLHIAPRLNITAARPFAVYVFTTIREGEVTPRAAERPRARRDDVNATHLVSPGPSGTA